MSQFAHTGKHGHYVSCGVVLLEPQDDVAATEQLHFTHRTAHGGDGDKEAVHGDLSGLAEVELARLKK